MAPSIQKGRRKTSSTQSPAFPPPALAYTCCFCFCFCVLLLAAAQVRRGGGGERSSQARPRQGEGALAGRGTFVVDDKGPLGWETARRC